MENLGLSSQQAGDLLKQNGRNEVLAKKPNFFIGLGKLLVSPITLMLLAAAILSFISQRYFDGYFILSLIFLNVAINAWQERKADSVIDQLQSTLSVKVRTIRDGKWIQIEAALLVVGDVVEINVGDLIPADAQIIESDNLTINESSLTGESLPQERKVNDKLFSGSYVATGFARVKVIATGKSTEFGKTLISIQKATKRSLLEEDILNISKMLSLFSIFAIIILTVVLIRSHQDLSDVLRLDLSLIIAGIPISLPTVMSIIIALGITQLAQKKVIVRRLSALENLSNVNLLLTDKTGTLTQNKITIEKIISYQNTKEELVKLAISTAGNNDKDPIEAAIVAKAKELSITPFKVVKRIPADSDRKRTTTTIKDDNRELVISIGATQVIEKLCQLSTTESKKFHSDIDQAAIDGNKTLAIAVNKKNLKEEKMELVGLILLSDPPRADAKETISYLNREGIEVKMVTGDNQAIGQKMANLVGIVGKILTGQDLRENANIIADKKWWKDKAGFAGVLPKDKYFLANKSKKNFVIAVTGDGVNDLPAVAAADVGIAVNNAVDALKSSADIVILRSGISSIKDALIEARKIFERLYSYSVYRISESFRLIVTIAILGFLIHDYPLTPIQIILIAFLNDLPILSLAYNRVKSTHGPSKSASKARLLKGLLFGVVGIIESLTMYYIMANIFHQPLAIIQTVFFLKLTVSGHLLIYVAHTEEKWYRFLPSKQVIWATGLTQFVASLIAFFGLLMSPISFGLIVFIWVWAIIWMQVADLVKPLVKRT